MSIAVKNKKWGPTYVQGIAPSNPINGQTWFDTADEELKIYDINEMNLDLTDRSGVSHHISNYGVVTNPDGSLYFDGSSHLEIESDSSLKFNADDFTIDFTFTLNKDLSTIHYLYHNGGAVVGSQASILIVINNGDLRFEVSNNGTSWDGYANFDGIILNKEYHVAALRNGDNIYLFLNGVLVDTDSFSGNVFTSTSYTSIYLGRRQDADEHYVKGVLSNIRISKGIDRTTDIDDPLYINTSNQDAIMFHHDMDENHLYEWTDNSNNGGTRTQTNFNDTSSIMLDSGTSTGISTYGSMQYDFGSIYADTFSLTVKLYHSALGVSTSDDGFQLALEKDDCRFNIKIGTEGINIFDGSAFNHQTGSGTWIAQDTWQTWRFDIDMSTPASATCDIYLGETLMISSVDCSDSGSFTDGRFTLTQHGVTTASQITYVDYLKINCEGFAVPTTAYTDDMTGSVMTGHKTVLYTGNGATGHAITGVGFQPDLVWVKNRTSTTDHNIVDSLRGDYNVLYPNDAHAEASIPTAISIDSDGFTVGINSHENTNGNNYVAWCWKADQDASYIDTSMGITEDCSTLPNGWTDASGGGGIISQTTFNSQECFKLDSGGSTGGVQLARIEKSISYGQKFEVEFEVYHDALGNITDDDNFQGMCYTGSLFFWFKLGLDGLLIHDGSLFNEVGTSLVQTGIWQTWKFVVDQSVPSSATCDVYLNNILQASNVDCSYPDSVTPIMFRLTQKGTTTANRISYINSIGANPTVIERYSEDSGLSMIKYTSTGSLATRNHSLGVAPDFMIFKQLSEASAWSVYHKDVGELSRLRLDDESFPATTTIFDDTAPTSTQFTEAVNMGGNNECIAYLWAEKAGYSKFGSYSGSSSPQSIDCGFRPSFVICKAISGVTYSWGMFDDQRGNADYVVYADVTTAESTVGGRMAFTDTGFTMTGGIFPSIAGCDFIYIAFAEGSDTREGSTLLIQPEEYEDWKMLATGNGHHYGYIAGGTISSDISTLDRMQFPFDSGIVSQVGCLSETKSSTSGCNSSNYGYVCGGKSSSTRTSVIDRITFPHDSGTATAVGNLSGTRSELSCNNSSQHGFTIIGTPSSGDRVSIIDRFEFPFDSGTASKVGNLGTSLGSACGNNSSQYGYNYGGYNGSLVISNIYRFTFPFDSGVSDTVGNLTTIVAYLAANNSSTHGFTIGGSLSSIIQRIEFPFDSGSANNIGNLSGSRLNLSANNSSRYGYTHGGSSGNNLSIIDRFLFPFNSGDASYMCNLSSSRTNVAGLDGTDFVTQFV